MKKSDRLFGPLTVAQLTSLFVTRGNEPRMLAAIEHELTYRKPAGLEKLRTALNQRVQKAKPNPDASAATLPTHAIVSCSRCNARLRFVYNKAKTLATCPKCDQDFDVEWQGMACVIQPRALRQTQKPVEASSGPLTLAQAYTAVGATSSEKWNPVVKQKCRSLMQQLHPDKSASAPAAVQKLAEREFKRVNEAYRLLERHLS